MPDPHVLTLEAAGYESPQRWRWKLLDAAGNFIADHQVALDPSAAEYEGFIDLYGYLDSHAAPDRRHQDEERLVQQVGPGSAKKSSVRWGKKSWTRERRWWSAS